MMIEVKLGKEQVFTIMTHWSQLDEDGLMFKEWMARKHKVFYRHEPDKGFISGDEKDITMFLLRGIHEPD